MTTTRDRDDVAALIKWLHERGEFESYADRIKIGMAIKVEYGDDGLELWRLTHLPTETAEMERSKWQSFATEPTPGCVTLASFLHRAHSLGWRGSVRKSVSSMFAGVAFKDMPLPPLPPAPLPYDEWKKERS